MRIASVLLVLFFLFSCGNWGWESIDTDNDEQLNIFGVISLDDQLESFIIIHKTLDTASPSDSVVGHDTIYFDIWEKYNEDTGMFEADTFWYDPPYILEIRESLYIVKDATVTISDGTIEYSFTRSPKVLPESEFVHYDNQDVLFSDEGIYRNIDSSFVPQPNTEYSLTITTPYGHAVSGVLRTPPIPQIYESDIDDTLSISNLFDVSWRYDGDYFSTIRTDFNNVTDSYYICGLPQYGTTQAGDTTWTSSIDSWCLENPDNTEGQTTLMDIKLRFLDENYYRYFLSADEAEISNFLIGEGSIGGDYGIEGGFGVFGSLSSSKIQRVAIP